MVTEVIFDYLVSTLGAALDRDGVEGWKNTLSAVNSVIAAYYNSTD